MFDKGCRRVIKAVWRGSFPYEAKRQVIRKIEKCRAELTQWSRKNFDHVRRQLIDKRKCFLQAKQQAMHGGSNNQVRGLKKEINELLVKENLMWRQQEKTLWLVDGDKNSRYFHIRATQRHRKNKILGVKDSSGAWLNQLEGIAEAFTNFYQQLFESSKPTLGLNSMVKVVTDDMNAQLS